jgi:hypothetical protein
MALAQQASPMHIRTPRWRHSIVVRMFSRLGVFTGCEGECREALIVGELEGVLQERCLAGWKERDVRLSL